MAERQPAEREIMFRPIPKIGVVLYALLMAFLQAHYITAQLYPNSEYFFGVWYGASDTQLMIGEALAIFANIGLLLSPFLTAPHRIVRLLMIASLAFGTIVGTISLVHIFSINALHPVWPRGPVDEYSIKWLIYMSCSYLIDVIAIYLYLSRLKRYASFFLTVSG